MAAARRAMLPRRHVRLPPTGTAAVASTCGVRGWASDELRMSVYSPLPSKRFSSNIAQLYLPQKLRVWRAQALSEAAKNRDWDEAAALFESHYETSNGEYAQMIYAAERCDKQQEAEELFAKMPVGPSSHRFGAFTFMLHMYGRLGNFQRSQELMEQLRTEGLTPDAVIYASLLKSTARSGSTSAMLQVWEDMLAAGVQPNAACFAMAINACADAHSADKAREMFDAMPSYGLTPTLSHWNLLLKARAFCEQLPEILQEFQQMMDAGVARDSASFTAVMETLRKSQEPGWQEKAAEYFKQAMAENIEIEDRLIRAAVSCRLGVRQDAVTPLFLRTAADQALEHTLADLQMVQDRGAKLPPWARSLDRAVRDALQNLRNEQRREIPIQAAAAASMGSGDAVAKNKDAGPDAVSGPWVLVESAAHGRYYWNKATNVTQWHAPEGLAVSETVSA